CPIIGVSGRNSVPTLVSVGGIVSHHWCQWGGGRIVPHRWCQWGGGKVPHRWCQWGGGI
ncbi:unnamed protein product, partial [Staurois parvus]